MEDTTTTTPTPTEADLAEHCGPRGLLSAAFAELNENGIAARQEWACCGSCSGRAMQVEIKRLIARGRTVRGSVAYNEQTAATSRRTGRLGLVAWAIGDRSGNDAIRDEVFRTLERYGLNPELTENGSIELNVGGYFMDEVDK